MKAYVEVEVVKSNVVFRGFSALNFGWKHKGSEDGSQTIITRLQLFGHHFTL
jgi:hypothetical protein